MNAHTMEVIDQGLRCFSENLGARETEFLRVLSEKSEQRRIQKDVNV